VIQIAVVEDNPDLCEELVFQLQHAGYLVCGYADGPAFDQGLIDQCFDIVVLDINLPGETGLAIAHRLRAIDPNIGIIMMTARGTVHDRVTGLNTGADFYLVKPVESKELLAVISSLSRRMATSATATNIPISTGAASGSASSGNGLWKLLPIQRCIISPEGSRIVLTETESRLLLQLAQAFPNVVPRRQLIESLGYEYLHFDERRLEAAMSRLRRKLRSNDEQLSPLRSARVQGYIFGERIVVEDQQGDGLHSVPR